ncbi:hypothetical protein HPULCUR_005784 [Helicostylum pulchrum]|uniref:Signal recognition particle 14 kDa protein n=1 Tax=Helicostylum pulchrum TaxID=562976 RepID=A0ABP9Y025_9FUNG
MASKVKKVMPKGGELVVENPKRDDVQYPCLVRAVSPDDFDRFQNAYSTIIRAYMDSLKKKDRSKKAKKVSK